MEIPSNGNKVSSHYHVDLRFYAKEFVRFVRKGGPLSTTYLFNFLQSQVVVAFADHLSVKKLGALGLTITYFQSAALRLHLATPSLTTLVPLMEQLAWTICLIICIAAFSYPFSSSLVSDTVPFRNIILIL